MIQCITIDKTLSKDIQREMSNMFSDSGDVVVSYDEIEDVGDIKNWSRHAGAFATKKHQQ